MLPFQVPLVDISLSIIILGLEKGRVGFPSY